MRLIILCLIFVDFLKHLGNCCEIVDCGSIESDCVISPDYWLNNETFFLSAGCPDSYFKLDFEFDQNTDGDAIFIAWNYKLTIEDPQIEIENGTFTYDVTAFFIIFEYVNAPFSQRFSSKMKYLFMAILNLDSKSNLFML